MERQWQRQRQKNGFPSRRPNEIEIEIEIEEVPSKVTLIFYLWDGGPLGGRSAAGIVE